MSKKINQEEGGENHQFTNRLVLPVPVANSTLGAHRGQLNSTSCRTENTNNIDSFSEPATVTNCEANGGQVDPASKLDSCSKVLDSEFLAEVAPGDLDCLWDQLAVGKPADKLEAVLRHPSSVRALKVDRAGKCTGEVWVSKTEREQFPLEKSYVSSLLSGAASLNQFRLNELSSFSRERFTCDGFRVLKKYDRRETLDKTSFCEVRMRSPWMFEVQDETGLEVKVMARWARQMIPKESLDRAKRRCPEYVRIIYGCQEEAEPWAGSAKVINETGVMEEEEPSAETDEVEEPMAETEEGEEPSAETEEKSAKKADDLERRIALHDSLSQGNEEEEEPSWVDDNNESEEDEPEFTHAEDEGDTASADGRDQLLAMTHPGEGSGESGHREEALADDLPLAEMAPDDLDFLWVGMEGRIEESIKDVFSPDCNRDCIASAKEELKKPSITKAMKRELVGKILDAQWTIRNCWTNARHEAVLKYPCSVHALKVDRDGEWTGEVWVSKTEREQVILEERYIGWLLNEAVPREERFGNGFARLGKYDRQESLDQAHFKRVRMLDPNTFEVIDVNSLAATVTRTWAMKNISKGALEEARRGLHGTNRREWPRIPCQSAGAVGTRPCKAGVAVSGPTIKYRNSNKKGGVCLSHSVASALHFLGYKKEAKEVSSKGHLASRSSRQVKTFKQLVLDSMNRTGGSKHRCKVPRCGQNKVRFDPRNPEHRRSNPVFAEIKAASRCNDGRNKSELINHAVCFQGDYIFDSNFRHALPISLESLNRICSNVTPGCLFDGIVWSRELVLDRACP